jgi:predicted dehydrogenase
MKTLRFGCIGCGGMGNLHTLNSKYIPGLDVVAFADVRKESAENFLAEFGGEYATDKAEDLFNDASLDGVFIITGEKYHAALGIAAAEAGKHIFMEKPAAATVDEAIELERAVRKNKVKYLIGFCSRLAPMVNKAKTLIGSPWISISQSMSNVSGQACHHLDLLVNVFHEAPLESVYASGGHAYDWDAHLPADSYISVLRFGDGSQANLTMHAKSPNPLLGKYSMQFMSSDRCVYLAKKFKEVHLCTNNVAPDISYIYEGPDFSPVEHLSKGVHFKNSRGPHGYMGHYEELVALCDSIHDDTETPITVEDGRYTLQVEKAILESVETRQVVDFKEYLARWDSRPPRR